MQRAERPSLRTKVFLIKALIQGLFIFPLLFNIYGCSDYTVKNPIKNIKKSIQTMNAETLVDKGPALSQFTLKYDVLKKWGYPDEIHLIGTTPIWGAPITCWVYYAWIPDFPVNYRNVAREYRLYFQGDTLMRWEDSRIPTNRADTHSWPDKVIIKNMPGRVLVEKADSDSGVVQR